MAISNPYQASGAPPQREDKTATRKKRRRSASSGGSSGNLVAWLPVRQGRRLYRFVLQKLSSRFVLSLPFFLLLLVTGTDFLILATQGAVSSSVFFDELGGRAYAVGRDEAEATKGRLLSFVYLGTLLLTAIQWRAVTGYFKRWPHLGVLIISLLITATYSIEPVKVITNTIIITVGFVAAILLTVANGTEKRYQGFYLCVLLPMLLVHIGSALIFFEQGQNLLDFFESGNRFGGLAGNPNSLGQTAVLGCWAALCLIFSSYVGRSLRIFTICAMSLFVLHIAMSGSGTSTLALTLVLGVFFWMRTTSKLKSVTRTKISIAVVFGASCALMAILVVTTPAEFYVTVAEGLGKDATLTGRTDVWDTAKSAISDHPFFGWGYDNHASVFATPGYEVIYNHYHNGYLDTLVAGGAFLFAIVMYHLARFLLVFRTLFLRVPTVFPFLLPLLMLLLLNLSEYSLLRPNSQIWAIYFASFVMLTFNINNSTPSASSTPVQTVKMPRTGKHRRSRLRW